MFKILYGTGPEVQAPVAEWYKLHRESNMGPLYIGAIFDFYFLGIFAHQLWRYYSCYRRDHVWIRRLVVATTVLSLYKIVPSFYVVWDKNIVNFGDWVNAVKVSWPLYTEVSASTVINTTAQTFFAWRCFTLTGRNWYLLAFLSISMLAVLTLSAFVCLVFAVDPYNNALLVKLGVPMIVLGFVIDAVITVTVSYKLLQHRGILNRSTDNLLAHLLSITWEAAVPPAVSQAINVALFAGLAHDNTWHLIFNMVTPRLYVFSLMYTLNSRIDVRLTASAPVSDLHEPVGLTTLKFRDLDRETAQSTTRESVPPFSQKEAHIYTLPGNPVDSAEHEWDLRQTASVEPAYYEVDGKMAPADQESSYRSNPASQSQPVTSLHP